jgi:hypothetical protein
MWSGFMSLRLPRRLFYVLMKSLRRGERDDRRRHERGSDGHGLIIGGRQGAREGLEALWDRVARLSPYGALQLFEGAIAVPLALPAQHYRTNR